MKLLEIIILDNTRLRKQNRQYRKELFKLRKQSKQQTNIQWKKIGGV